MGYQTYRVALATCPCRTPTSMDKDLVVGRVVEMQYVVYLGDVQPSCCDVRDDEDSFFAFPESVERVFSHFAIHFPIYAIAIKLFLKVGQQVVNMEPCAHKNDNLVFNFTYNFNAFLS